MICLKIAVFAAIVALSQSLPSIITYPCSYASRYTVSCGWWSTCSRYRTSTRTCYKYSAVVDGGWTDWKEWQDIDECSVLCGGGSKDQERARSCTNPAPAYGGADCDGDKYQTQTITCGNEDCGDRCPGGVTYLPHPTNERRYYQCGNGVAYRHDCADGTVWDQDILGCANAPATPKSCPATGVSYIAHESDCNKYNWCVNGVKYEMGCPATTRFDVDSNVCVHNNGECQQPN